MRIDTRIDKITDLSDDMFRRIDTRMYSDIAFEILYAFAILLSEGLNSYDYRAMFQYKKYSDFFTVKQDVDGRIYLKVSKEQSSFNARNAFLDMTDDQILKWIASKIKYTATKDIHLSGEKNEKWWRRDNNAYQTSLFNFHQYDDNRTKIFMSDIYVIHEELSGKYKNPIAYERIYGRPKTKEEIIDEQKLLKRKEELIKEFQTKYIELEKEHDAVCMKHSEIMCELHKKYSSMIKELGFDETLKTPNFGMFP